MNLRIHIAKLAQENPELRKHLVPLLQRTAMEHATEDALKKYLRDHPKANPKNHSVKKPGGGSKKEKDTKKFVSKKPGVKIDERVGYGEVTHNGKLIGYVQEKDGHFEVVDGSHAYYTSAKSVREGLEILESGV